MLEVSTSRELGTCDDSAVVVLLMIVGLTVVECFERVECVECVVGVGVVDVVF